VTSPLAPDVLAAARAFAQLLRGHSRRFRTARLQDVATETLRDPTGRSRWVVPAINSTIRLRQSLTRICYLDPRRVRSRVLFGLSHEDTDAYGRRCLSILCPTRERTARLDQLLRSIHRTARAAQRVEVLCYVDSDDPEIEAYRRLSDQADQRWPGLGRVLVHVGPPVGVAGAWNALAGLAAGDCLLMGNDDQIYIDYGWDVALDRRVDELTDRHPDGILCLYFDAGRYVEGECDFPIITRQWYKTLGYFSPTRFQQWQNERWIFDIASRVDRRYAVPGVLVEHLHYQDYKAPFDATYQRHRMTREKSLADQSLFICTDAEREADAERLRLAMSAWATSREEPPAMSDPGIATEDGGTRQYILQTARRHYGNLIDAWHYGGRTDDARACAELAVRQGVWAHPLQRPRELVPGLTAAPLHDPEQFWFVPYLEERYLEIRAEIERVVGTDRDPVRPTVDDGALIRSGEWKQAHLFRDGQWQEDVCARFPVTRSILAEVPEVTSFSPGVITVSTVEPGSHIMPHCGPTNALLRIHLPIRVPEGVSIRVADQWLTWTEGRCMVFDDSFEHEVRHDGDEDRVVLILDTLHPELGGDHQQRLRQHRLTAEEQILSFMRQSGFDSVTLTDGQIAFHPGDEMRRQVERYLEATGIVGAELRGDEVVWHSRDDG
jgi:hypothetical protein